MSLHSQATEISADRLSSRPGGGYRRIVVKAGTSLLTGGSGQLDSEVMTTLVEQIARLQTSDRQMMLVTSGAVAAGRHVLGITRDSGDVPMRQVLAAVGQGRLMHAYEQFFDPHSIPVAQALLSRRDLRDRLSYLNVRNTLLGLIGERVVPIINENDVVAVEEMSGQVFGDNDTLAAMVANVVDADLLLMLGEMEGLFTADPHLDSDARLISNVDRLDEEIDSVAGPAIEEHARGGMATKIEAARLATASGVDTVIASGLTPDVVTRLADGEAIGTFFAATSTRLESRQRWMVSQASESDAIVVDEGAAQALASNNRSLLPPGVMDTVGAFERGDIVSIVRPDRERIACGIANYSSSELSKIKRLRSSDIADTLGHHYGDEIVHRNNMVVLS
ncbi:glutamate 5-kinase [Dehalococcoidia bacterium]|nr:glutamate 5-kinase [Dehalococcoidia bacterium]